MLGEILKPRLKFQMDTRTSGHTGSSENIDLKNDMMQQVTGRIGLLGGKKFLYIPYEANQITYVETELDCISTRFTGCVMAAFMWNGKRCVAHVATPECNDRWNTLKTEITLLSEFNPSRYFDTKYTKSIRIMHWNHALDAAKLNDENSAEADCFGIIDSENNKYAGFLIKTFLGIQTNLSQFTVNSCVPVT